MQIGLKDIESELSYAYLHAVASHAGAECKIAGRLSDNRGIDAQLTAWGPFPGGGPRTEVDLKIQLKATVQAPTSKGANWGYELKDVARYDDLRSETYAVPRILVVLYLPGKKEEWISCTSSELALRNCAYWVSLRGAPDVATKTSVTVYLPKKQILTSESLRNLFVTLSHGESPKYGGAAA